MHEELLKDEYPGWVRLFPLPNLVLFPNVVQGLHLFEPRYRTLAADSISSDGTFAMAILKPDWNEYDDKPAVYEYACLGRIQQYEKLSDGRYHMRLRGISRIKLTQERATETLYRIADAELLPEDRPDDIPKLISARKKLAELVLTRFQPSEETSKQLMDLFSSESPLGHVVDLLAYSLPLKIELKYKLLSEEKVWPRFEILCNELMSIKKPILAYPPNFSKN